MHIEKSVPKNEKSIRSQWKWFTLSRSISPFWMDSSNFCRFVLNFSTSVRKKQTCSIVISLKFHLLMNVCSPMTCPHSLLLLNFTYIWPIPWRSTAKLHHILTFSLQLLTLMENFARSRQNFTNSIENTELSRKRAIIYSNLTIAICLQIHPCHCECIFI